MRAKDTFEKFMSIEDKNYKKEMKEKNLKQIRRETFNMPLI